MYFARKLNRSNINSMKYIYLGYYIENCIKMRYKVFLIKFYKIKGEFTSYILCPKSLKWFKFEEMRRKYDLSKFVVFSENKYFEFKEMRLLTKNEIENRNMKVFKKTKLTL